MIDLSLVLSKKINQLDLTIIGVTYCIMACFTFFADIPDFAQNATQ